MDKCSPVEMRKNLETVELYKLAGIDFVAVPVLNKEDKNNILQFASARLNLIIKETEKGE